MNENEKVAELVKTLANDFNKDFFVSLVRLELGISLGHAEDMYEFYRDSEYSLFDFLERYVINSGESKPQ